MARAAEHEALIRQLRDVSDAFTVQFGDALLHGEAIFTLPGHLVHLMTAAAPSPVLLVLPLAMPEPLYGQTLELALVLKRDAVEF